MRLALAGDTMLGRGVAELIPAERRRLFSPEVVEETRSADLFVLNLECCISDRGEPWPAPGKPFFFRAPASAIEVLLDLGVDCVTLANNHALDFGFDALVDTLELLDSAGIAHAGAGRDVHEARRPARLSTAAAELSFYGASDHPADYAAKNDRPGTAFADLRSGDSGWLASAVATDDRDVVVGPHWGPNMTVDPPRYVRNAARALVQAGALLIAGHSAHVFHGVDPPILYDMGDFIDDYAVDPILRNDLSLLFVVTLSRGRIERIEAIPLKLDYCHTRLAEKEEADWIAGRFADACRTFGTPISREGARLVIQVGDG